MTDRPVLKPFEERWMDEYLTAAGLKRLSPMWAKLEILLGLAAAVAGLKLLQGDGPTVIGGGALAVLGLYLALAGNRSHLYQSQNKQAAFLLQTILTRPNGKGQAGEPAPHAE
jgi:hypothetical protein